MWQGRHDGARGQGCPNGARWEKEQGRSETATGLAVDRAPQAFTRLRPRVPENPPVLEQGRTALVWGGGASSGEVTGAECPSDSDGSRAGEHPAFTRTVFTAAAQVGGRSISGAGAEDEEEYAEEEEEYAEERGQPLQPDGQSRAGATRGPGKEGPRGPQDDCWGPCEPPGQPQGPLKEERPGRLQAVGGHCPVCTRTTCGVERGLYVSAQHACLSCLAVITRPHLHPPHAPTYTHMCKHPSCHTHSLMPPHSRHNHVHVHTCVHTKNKSHF